MVIVENNNIQFTCLQHYSKRLESQMPFSFNLSLLKYVWSTYSFFSSDIWLVAKTLACVTKEKFPEDKTVANI